MALQKKLSARLKYALPARTLSRKDCTAIMSSAVKAALSKSVMCATMATAIRNGPKSSGGIGCLSLFDYMGTSRAVSLMEHSFRCTPVGKITVQNIENMVEESGLYGSLWDMDFDVFSKWISPHSWIFQSCKYNHDNMDKLSIPHMEIGPRRSGDRSIMMVASWLYNDTFTLKSINRVRMSNNVYNLSDITKVDGRCSSDNDSDNKHMQAIRNRHIWPTKHHTSSVDYIRWRNFIRTLYSEDFKLPSSLDPWLNNTSVCIQS